MTYVKIVTSLVTSESINFDDVPDVQMLNTYDPGSDRNAESRIVTCAQVDDTPTPLLIEGDMVRDVTIQALDGPIILLFDEVNIAVIPEAGSMSFVALNTEEEQALYTLRSNSDSTEYRARVITTSYDTL